VPGNCAGADRNIIIGADSEAKGDKKLLIDLE
jgi:hypothetical protein